MDNFFWSNKKESDTKNKVGDELSDWSILDDNKYIAALCFINN